MAKMGFHKRQTVDRWRLGSDMFIYPPTQSEDVCCKAEYESNALTSNTAVVSVWGCVVVIAAAGTSINTNRSHTGEGGGSEDLDIEQSDVSHHLHLVDPAQLLHSVFVVELVDAVHGHSELLCVTHDDHLHRKHTAEQVKTNKLLLNRGQRSQPHLKVLSRSKGEWVQFCFFRAPTIMQEGVSDEGPKLQTRVQVQSDVAASCRSQVHTETERPNTNIFFYHNFSSLFTCISWSLLKSLGNTLNVL